MVRDAKHRYRECVESHFHHGDTQSMRHRLRNIADYKVRDTTTINVDSAFTNELKESYARFKVSQVASANYSPTTEDGDVSTEEQVISIVEHDV